jgi:hypothetical protein
LNQLVTLSTDTESQLLTRRCAVVSMPAIRFCCCPEVGAEGCQNLQKRLLGDPIHDLFHSHVNFGARRTHSNEREILEQGALAVRQNAFDTSDHVASTIACCIKQANPPVWTNYAKEFSNHVKPDTPCVSIEQRQGASMQV